MHRLRIRFGRGEEIKFISHLDIMRLWERAFRRAGVTLAYSEGYSPHPRISLAAPLAVGVTSESELMDIFLPRWLSSQGFTAAIGRQLPSGVEVLGVYQVALALPSLQSQVRHAEYQVKLETGKDVKEIEAAISKLLALEHLPWQHRRDTGLRSYDLRVLVEDIWLSDFAQPYVTIGMRLRCGSSGSGRPEQVSSALGFDGYPQSIHRTRLILGS